MQSEEKKCSPTWELSETSDLTNAKIFAKPRILCNERTGPEQCCLETEPEPEFCFQTTRPELDLGYHFLWNWNGTRTGTRGSS